MKLFLSTQIQKINKRYFMNMKLTINLIKNCFTWIKKKFSKKQKFLIFCGNSYHGVHGLLLFNFFLQEKYKVKIYIIDIIKTSNIYFQQHIKDLQKNNKNLIFFHKNQKNIKKLKINIQESIIIDSIISFDEICTLKMYTFNYLIDIINCYKQQTISIDIPSGLFPDVPNNKKINSINVIKSNYTLSLEIPKLCFMFKFSENFINTWNVIKTKYFQNFVKNIKSKYYLLDIQLIKQIYRIRKKFTDKDNFGHSFIVGGRYGMIGAMVLASKSNIVSGSGKTTVYIPACGYNIIQTKIPEVIVKTDKNYDFIKHEISVEKNVNAVAIGPGLGVENATKNFMIKFFNKINKKIPIVIDADGINIIAKHKSILNIIQNRSIITPHKKEFIRLFGDWKDEHDKIKLIVKKSQEYNIYIIYKDKHTIIATPDGTVFFNNTGNNGMSTSGSGDVLTGIITSLLSQKYSKKEACLLGVYIHGMAGDIALTKESYESIISSNIINNIGKAYNYINNYKI